MGLGGGSEKWERKGGFSAQGESGEYAVVFASQNPFLLLVIAPSCPRKITHLHTPTPISKGRHRIVEHMALGLKNLIGKQHKNKQISRDLRLSKIQISPY